MSATGFSRSDLLNITFEIAGMKMLDRTLGIAIKHVKDISGVGPDIRDDFIKNQIKQFSTEGKHGSTHRVFFGLFNSQGWKPLSPQYAAEKAARWGKKGILVRTGSLQDSLTKAKDENFIYQAKKKSITLGTSVSYATYHQTGTRTGLAQRPPMELVEDQKRRWPKLIQEYILKSGQVDPTDRIII